MPRTQKRTLSATFVEACKPAAAGQRDEYWDDRVPGFGLRVTERGAKTYVLYARTPPGYAPARLALGDATKLGLAAAREKARAWLDLIAQGKDPRAVEREVQLAEHREKQTTFAAVTEDFIADKLPTERKGKEVERDIRRNLLPALGRLPITEITSQDILPIIRAKKLKHPAQARNLLGIIKRLFSWTLDQHRYGLTANPAEGLKPTKIIGEKKSGSRILSDVEMFALWRAAKRMPYPFGQVYQLLMLTALRLNEAAKVERPELNIVERIWIIPATRMKGTRGKARAHAVPLTDDLVQLFESLPRFRKGPYLFTTMFGERPVAMGSKIKKQLDARMLRTLRALARQRGDDPAEVTLPPWTNHDIRRSVRTNLSKLRIAEEVREAILAHVRPGIKATYDLHDYLVEKREALTLWGARLNSIVNPSRDNVVPLRGGVGQ
jgi:hypothetical protein